jgi:uncharacterized membrane protein
MSWWLLLLLAAGSYALRAAGPLLLGGREAPPRAEAVLALLPPALLASLVVTQTFADGQAVVLDSRAAGVAVGAVAVWRGASFLPAAAIGAVTAALLRLLGLP